MPKIIITMPAYRAELTLAQTVADIPDGVADELILVDDASPDNTAQLARDLGIKVYVHPTNRGYGGNQKTCYTQALAEGADIVVMLHPDYQYEPKAVPLLIAPILAGDADMTFGSRFAGLGDPRGGGMPMYRFLGNRLTTLIENLMLGSRFTEMHSGMRAYTRRCLLSLPFLGYSDDFAFDAQLMVDAVTSGQRVIEVPIPTRYTKESSSISIVKSLRYVMAGIVYAARQARVRGRRGRRWQVARERALPRRSVRPLAAPRPSPPAPIERLQRRMSAFPAAPGDVVTSAAAGRFDGAGTVVLTVPLEEWERPVEALKDLAASLEPEGSVGFVSDSPGDAVGAALDDAGFTMIDWHDAGGGHALVIARLVGP